METLYQSRIAGDAGPVDRTAVAAPFDGGTIAEIETVGSAGVERALAVAHGLFRDRRGWLPLPRRIEILEKTAALMTERAEDLALEAAREGGKPLVDSRVEAARAIDSLRICIDCLRTDAGDVVPMDINAASSGKQAFTFHEPIGVVVAISAFNHPLNLITHQVGPAIAAGCPVIV
ncbi:MAG: aldehyde dehydrogenase family protein, partial [Xanthomonadaceae bacterium]|nr:aldehyde dehydrogenase family protein [Xanthomonadaceae bacterium]